MTSKGLAGPHRNIVVASILLLCSAALFLLYYKPTMSWQSCPENLVPKQDLCTEACRSVLEGKNRTQAISECSINHTLVQEHTPNTPSPHLEKDVVPKAPEPETVVLIWKWPFGGTFDLNSCESDHGIKGCRLTVDRGQLDKAHSVMFHVRDIGGDLLYLKTLPRPPGQKWVWMNMESPTHTPQLAGAEDLFNLTSNYRRDSDVWMPYGRLIEASEEQIKAFKIPDKSKFVCWIVSNWNNNYRRVGFFNELSKHIKIETYGRHFGRYIDHNSYSEVVSSCKFYLSFENSIHRDYITEKAFNPMSLGTVPVVLGPPRENYEEFMPADSFIHVDDFKTPQKLAEHLKLLDQDQTMYEKFFTWRKDYVVRGSGFGQEHACRICDHVQRNKNFRIFKNVNKWYFS